MKISEEILKEEIMRNNPAILDTEFVETKNGNRTETTLMVQTKGREYFSFNSSIIQKIHKKLSKKK